MADISVALELNDSQYVGKLTQAEKKTKDFTDKTDKGLRGNKESFERLSHAAETVKSKMESLGSILLGVGLVEFVRNAMDGADQLIGLANSVGVTTEAMLEMQQAALGVNKNGQDVGNMLSKMEVAAQGFADGLGTTRRAFTDLGISFNDLQTKSPDEVLRMAAHALANMSDNAQRSATAMEIFGKAGKIMDWKGFAQGLDAAAGSQAGVAAGMEAAEAVMSRLSQQTQEIKNQFLLLIAPITEWIAPFIGGTNQAAVSAKILAGIMAVFASGAVIVGVNALVTSITSLAATFGMSAGAAETEAKALAVNAASTINSARAKLQLAAASEQAIVASLELAQTHAIETGATSVAEKITWRLDVARSRLAGTTAQLNVINDLTTVSTGALSGAEVVATGTTNVFSAAMARARVAVATMVGPITAVVALLGSAYALFQATLGSEHGIFRETGDQSGANFISDFFGVTDTSGDKAAEDAKAQMKKVQDAMNAELQKTASKVGVIGGNVKPTDLNESFASSLRLQADVAALTNRRAEERIKLQTDLVGKTQQQSAAELAAFDAQTTKLKEVQRIEAAIAKAKADRSKLHQDDAASLKINTDLVKLLEQQKANVEAQDAVMGALTAKLIQRQNAEKINSAFEQTQLNVEKDLQKMKLDTEALTMTTQEKQKQAIMQKINDETAAIIKIKQEQVGADAITMADKQAIHDQVAANYQAELTAQDELNRKSREFGTGWKQSWNQFSDDANNAALQAKATFNTMTQTADDAFKQLVNTGKVQWKQLLDNMIMQFMQADFHRLVASAMNPSSGSGGFLQGVGKFFAGGFATGGTIPAGGYGITGENGPEYVNGPATITPMRKGQTAQPTIVQYNISAVDAKSFQQMIAADPSFIHAVAQQGARSSGA